MEISQILLGNEGEVFKNWRHAYKYSHGSTNINKSFNFQGVSYSQKFCSKLSLPNFANCRTSQFRPPKYLDSTNM